MGPPAYISTKWPHSSLFRCSVLGFAKYVSRDLILPTNFGLHDPLLYPSLRMLKEFVLDGDVDEDDEDVGSDGAEVLLCENEK